MHEEHGEEYLSLAVMLAAAVCSLNPDGTFPPEEYLDCIGEAQRAINKEWPEASG